MKKIYIYLITRDDGKKYIGQTIDLKSRMGAHRKSKRFKDNLISESILGVFDTQAEADTAEEMYITEHDSFNNGLNNTPHGRGLNEYANFSTKGSKHTEETKRKMKLAWKRKKERGYVHSHRNMAKFTEEEVKFIRNEWDIYEPSMNTRPFAEMILAKDHFAGRCHPDTIVRIIRNETYDFSRVPSNGTTKVILPNPGNKKLTQADVDFIRMEWEKVKETSVLTHFAKKMLVNFFSDKVRHHDSIMNIVRRKSWK